MSNSLRPHGLYSPWNSPGQNTGVGSLSLLQGIFPTQGSNPGLLHCRQILYQLSHHGSPRILEWQPIPSPTDLPDPGIKLGSPVLQVDSLPTELSGKPNNTETKLNTWKFHKSPYGHSYSDFILKHGVSTYLPDLLKVCFLFPQALQLYNLVNEVFIKFNINTWPRCL